MNTTTRITNAISVASAREILKVGSRVTVTTEHRGVRSTHGPFPIERVSDAFASGLGTLVTADLGAGRSVGLGAVMGSTFAGQGRTVMVEVTPGKDVLPEKVGARCGACGAYWNTTRTLIRWHSNSGCPTCGERGQIGAGAPWPIAAC